MYRRFTLLSEKINNTLLLLVIYQSDQRSDLKQTRQGKNCILSNQDINLSTNENKNEINIFFYRLRGNNLR